MSELEPEEREAIRAMADVVRKKEAGLLTVDDAIRRIGEIVSEEDARVLAKRRTST